MRGGQYMRRQQTRQLDLCQESLLPRSRRDYKEVCVGHKDTLTGCQFEEAVCRGSATILHVICTWPASVKNVFPRVTFLSWLWFLQSLSLPLRTIGISTKTQELRAVVKSRSRDTRSEMSGGFEDSFIVTATIEGQAASAGASARSPREVTPTKTRQGEAATARSPVSIYSLF